MKVVFALLVGFASIAISFSAQAGPRLYVFDCGILYLDDISIFNLSASDTDVRELFVPCYVVKHQGKFLLFDGGVPKLYADKSGLTPIDGGHVAYERWIVDQLEDVNLTPSDIDYAAYSHLHWDHAGSANYFINSTVLMQKTEWDGAFGKEAAFIETALFDQLKDANLQMLNGDHDVFGDNAVRLIYTPGHTAGHQALYVDLENTGPIVLSGDLYHFRENRSLKRPPTFNLDAKQTLKSMSELEALLTETGATLWIEHDKALADTLRKAPYFYD